MLKSIFSWIKQLNKMSFLIVPLLAVQLAVPSNFVANAVNGSNQDFQVIKFEPVQNTVYNLGETVRFAITLKNITQETKSVDLVGYGFRCLENDEPIECGTDARYISETKSYNFYAGQTKTISYSFKPDEIGYWQVDIFDPPWQPGQKIAYGAIIKIINSKIDIDKTVRNISNGTDFSKLSIAEINDILEFKLRIFNTGNIPDQNIKVWDKLPSKLSYINGSTQIDGDPINDDSIASGGIILDDVQPNETVEITFRTRVVDFYCPAISKIVANYAYAKIIGKSKIYSDYADVKILKCDIPQNAELSISKLAKNYTKNSFMWTDNVSSQPADVIEFSIQVRNTGNTTATNVYLYDILPNRMAYINNSTSIDNQSASDKIISGDGLFLGNFIPYQTKTIKFKARILGNEYFPANHTTVIANNAYAYADDIDEISDNASVSVFYSITTPPTPTPPTPTPTPVVLGAADVKTGPEDSLIFISILSFILTCALFVISKKLKQAGLISALKLKALIMKIRFAEIVKF